MARARRRLAGRARRLAGRLRRAALSLLGGVVPEPTPVGLPVEQVARLVLGATVAPRTLEQAVEAAGVAEVTDLSSLRRMLAVVDGHLDPSPVLVKLGTSDVAWAEVDGVQIAVDTADVAVSRTVWLDSYEPHLSAVFREYCQPGMTVLDVGANIGYYSLLAASRVGPNGRVIAVEPSSENCRLLLASAARNGYTNLSVIPVAAAERRGWSYFGPNLGSNGALLPHGADRLLEWPGTVVPTFPLDELVEGPVHLVKLDVEGVEPRVLEGARRIVETYRPVVTSEFSPGMMRIMCGRSAAEYLGFFLERGYRIRLLERGSNRRVAVSEVAELLSPPDRLDDILLVPEELAEP